MNKSTCEQDTTAILPGSLKLYSVQQVANILQVRESAVRKLIFGGKLAANRVGIFIRIRQDAIEHFLEESPCREPDPRRDPLRTRRSRPRDGLLDDRADLGA